LNLLIPFQHTQQGQRADLWVKKKKRKERKGKKRKEKRELTVLNFFMGGERSRNTVWSESGAIFSNPRAIVHSAIPPAMACLRSLIQIRQSEFIL